MWSRRIQPRNITRCRGCGSQEPHKVVTCGDGPIQWGAFNDRLQEKYQRIRENEKRFESYYVDDADIILVAYGSMARVCVSAMNMARAEGRKVGMIRPISLWPFPISPLRHYRKEIPGMRAECWPDGRGREAVG